MSLTDAEVLTKMFAARNGADVRRLWEGDVSEYPSPSEADLALCRHLAFWTGGQASRIDALFRQSGLYREKKWNRQDYRERTISKALAPQGYRTSDHRPRTVIPPWYQRAQVWTGPLTTIDAQEAPSWH